MENDERKFVAEAYREFIIFFAIMFLLVLLESWNCFLRLRKLKENSVSYPFLPYILGSFLASFTT